MADASRADLGMRIVQAARLAVAMHLAGSGAENLAGRQVRIGGAGPTTLKEEHPPETDERPRRSTPSLPPLAPPRPREAA